jgi:Mitochondrial carrier protein
MIMKLLLPKHHHNRFILFTLRAGGLGSFWTGAICSNLAWLTIWPLDVAKSQIQSGDIKYAKMGYFELMGDIVKKRLLFRGLLPGLSRSFIANGLSMVAYDKVNRMLKDIRIQSV